MTSLLLDAQCKMVMFWANLSEPCNTPKLSTLLFRFSFKLYNGIFIKSIWIKAIKDIVERLSRYLGKQSPPMQFKKQNLKDESSQKWSFQVNQSSTCLNYRMGKLSLKLLLNVYGRLDLGVETTSFRGCRNGVLRENRICTYCNVEVGDEFHYLFKCSHINIIRKRSFNCRTRSKRIRKPVYIREMYNFKLRTTRNAHYVFLVQPSKRKTLCGL